MFACRTYMRSKLLLLLYQVEGTRIDLMWTQKADENWQLLWDHSRISIIMDVQYYQLHDVSYVLFSIKFFLIFVIIRILLNYSIAIFARQIDAASSGSFLRCLCLCNSYIIHYNVIVWVKFNKFWFVRSIIFM